jgi:FkbM family methyltransferase
MALLRYVRSALERSFRCRIYRNTLPRGTDLFFDFDRTFGNRNFRTVFDIGANIGQSAERYLHAFPLATVYSFEPVPATYRELESLGKRAPRLRTFCCAMGAKEGEVEINVHPFDRMSSIQHRRPEDRAVPVRLRTIADFCREQRLTRIDFMKIDTEGYELEVLKGAGPMLAEQQIRILSVECEPVLKSNYFVSFSEISAALYRYKYELFGIYDQQPSFTGEHNIYFFNPVFICPELIAPAARLQGAIHSSA